MLFCRKEEEKRILMKEDARDPRGLSVVSLQPEADEAFLTDLLDSLFPRDAQRDENKQPM
jgi:hypothetical protein